MNKNQDLIDLINLNRMLDFNDNCLVPEDEKAANAMVIKREQRIRMNRLRLSLTPEQMKQSKEQENELLKRCI